MSNANANIVSRGSLNTLAQSRTEVYQNKNEKPCVIVHGQGSPLGDAKVLKGRGKRKNISLALALSLISIAEKKGENPDKCKAIWNTFYCQNRIISVDDRHYGEYCKNRYCTLCCSIRKAVIINKYYPVMKEWENPYFLTLTIKAIPANLLKNRMKAMIRAFRKIKDRIQTRYERGKGSIKLMGIKSLECNYNPDKRTYNPHFHLTLPNKEVAEALLAEWLTIWTPKNAGPLGQFMRPVKNLEKDLIETIKYGGKVFTEPDIDKKEKGNYNKQIYAKALYNIFDAMKGLRIFDRFGFNLPKQEKVSPRTMVAKEYTEWKFAPECFDWINSENDNTLTNYLPTAQLLTILENMDMERE